MTSPSASASAGQGPSWADRLGVWMSAACFVHCLVTPFLLSFSVVFVHLLPSEERTHRVLAASVALLGAAALANGFRRHRRLSVVTLMLCGLACVFGAAWWGDRLPGHLWEVGLTLLGSTLMITAHRLNHTFCRSCACVPQAQR